MNYIEQNYEQLFNTRFDPHEIENLATDPVYKSKFEEMQKRYTELKAKYSVTAEERAKINKAF